MKITPISILGCICLILCAFLCGLYLGRSMSSSDIETEVLFTEPSASNGTSATSATSATTSTFATTATTPTSATQATSPTTPGKININTADLATLMTLKGIGEVYAQRIIDYRNENGPFTDIIDITNVPGIGTKRFEAIMDEITVGG